MELRLLFETAADRFDADAEFKHGGAEGSFSTFGNFKGGTVESFEIGAIRQKIAVRLSLTDGRTGTFIVKNEDKCDLILTGFNISP